MPSSEVKVLNPVSSEAGLVSVPTELAGGHGQWP